VANFVLCIDADPERRRRFIEAAGARLPIVPGLISGTASSGDFSAAWAVAPRAPFAHVTDGPDMAIVSGEPFAEDGQRLGARQLLESWSQSADASLRADQEGYYAACVWLGGRGMIVGTDALGRFPIYYYELGGVLLIGSSPETFACHPAFRTSFNPAGLVGVLLMNVMFDGQAFLGGVKRLGPGHVLTWEPQTGVKETPTYRPPLTDRHRDLTFSQHVDILDEAMTAVVARHAPAGRSYALSLSGGLDSRLLAGYLHRAGRDVSALTLGARSDIDVQCAVAVARALGLPNRLRELDASRHVEYAKLTTTWEHCASGCSLVMQWGMVELLTDLPPHVVMGHSLDALIGMLRPSNPPLSFETYFARWNRWGLPPTLLQTLLRPDVFSGAVPETMDRMQRTYTSYSDVESRRAWTFGLYHRQRFYSASDQWRTTFTGWPVVPATDRVLVELGSGLPQATITNRRAQLELLRTQFPELAALPLDRNAWDATPPVPGLAWMLKQRLRSPVDRVRQRLARITRGSTERRRYYRLFDINSPGWVAIRQEAEPCRELAHAFFERKALAELLPPPDVPIQSADPIKDVSGIKNVLGFMLWARDHLR
jgi:asparagine synthase (glutamine-hydrolysing)